LAEYNLFGVPFWVQQMPLLLSRWALRLHENPAPFQPAFCR
jgi:hypothetical protein